MVDRVARSQFDIICGTCVISAPNFGIFSLVLFCLSPEGRRYSRGAASVLDTAVDETRRQSVSQLLLSIVGRRWQIVQCVVRSSARLRMYAYIRNTYQRRKPVQRILYQSWLLDIFLSFFPILFFSAVLPVFLSLSFSPLLPVDSFVQQFVLHMITSRCFLDSLYFDNERYLLASFSSVSFQEES